ncbi:cell division inhibition protein DicB [Escherichia coli]|uniref:cell division inhibition protein DicB n=1 Tax=Escherichia coli TaxID=562 RepID=UPI0019E4EE68|nr:cell division inhibition protein DicB [Escherichia coli]EHD0856275.1 cell division inhibition protein DicB [Escherichia coli]EKL8621698.1 cell division inhibition protein DicB [Escherichia coli]EKU6280183.1 cell division inhibition protein DicB [Escherichia coli]EKU6313765.1 cell division inhibition protein DicB [Escherichia coli]EKX1536285.1 cell division inhibition protein DicB [Escherichia coli]
MKTLLPNVNTSEGCFEIGVTISNPVFTEDAINKRKQERELLNKICICSQDNAGVYDCSNRTENSR